MSEKKTLFVPVVLGTARKERKSERAATFVHAELAKRDDVESELVDVRDFSYTATVPPWGSGGANEEPTKWKELVERADGLILIVPEYNHGYPGELKLLLDSLYSEYAGKAVALCGVSAGGFGGTRVVDHIKPVLVELGMVPTKSAMYFSKVGKVLDEDGTPLDKELPERFGSVVEELLQYARAMNTTRG